MFDLYNITGPVVNIIVVHTDGTLENRKVDMSPRLDPMGNVLGGPITIHGQLHALETIIIKCQETDTEIEKNKHMLPPPFHNDIIYGNMVLVRMDKHAIPQSIYSDEYLSFKQSNMHLRNGKVLKK